MRKNRIVGVAAAATLLVGVIALPAFAGHNGASISYDSAACAETTFEATITDSAGTHKVSNMYLVVNADGVTQSVNVPVDGSSASISVGPFGSDTTVSWNVFGGGERSYDQPLWNGYGGPTFSSDITAYAAGNDGYGWVLAGPDDPNPFVNWNEFIAEGCSVALKDDCKDGGWESFGFKDQGQCIRFFNTGKDSW
jgi:hypothetical protein